MKKSVVLKTYQDDTKKVSDISRNLSFTGLAVVWIFNKTVNNNIQIPHDLILPAILFVFSLIFDLLQYLYGGISYYFLYRDGKTTKTNNSKGETEEYIEKPRFINYPKWSFFIIKMILLAIGYVYLLGYLICLFNK